MYRDSGVREELQVGKEPVSQQVTSSPSPNRSSWIGLTLRLALRALINPRLAIDLLAMVWAFRARDWYRNAPFLPLPPRDYTRWRLHTAYGDPEWVPSVEDVRRFARWRRELLHL